MVWYLGIEPGRALNFSVILYKPNFDYESNSFVLSHNDPSFLRRKFTPLISPVWGLLKGTQNYKIIRQYLIELILLQGTISVMTH